MAIIRTFGHKWKLQDLKSYKSNKITYPTPKYFPHRCWNNSRWVRIVYICSIHSQNFLKTQIERLQSRIRRHHHHPDIEIERLHIIDLFVWCRPLALSRPGCNDSMWFPALLRPLTPGAPWIQMMTDIRRDGQVSTETRGLVPPKPKVSMKVCAFLSSYAELVVWMWSSHYLMLTRSSARVGGDGWGLPFQAPNVVTMTDWHDLPLKMFQAARQIIYAHSIMNCVICFLWWSHMPGICLNDRFWDNFTVSLLTKPVVQAELCKMHNWQAETGSLARGRDCYNSDNNAGPDMNHNSQSVQ